MLREERATENRDEKGLIYRIFRNKLYFLNSESLKHCMNIVGRGGLRGGTGYTRYRLLNPVLLQLNG